MSVGDALPSGELVLSGVQPNPSRSGFAVAFTLPDDRPALLEVIDLQGRQIVRRELAGRADEPGGKPAGDASTSGRRVRRAAEPGWTVGDDARCGGSVSSSADSRLKFPPS